MQIPEIIEMGLAVAGAASAINAITPEPKSRERVTSWLDRLVNIANVITTIIGLDKEFVRQLRKQ
jgi:hypothetical protein